MAAQIGMRLMLRSSEHKNRKSLMKGQWHPMVNVSVKDLLGYWRVSDTLWSKVIVLSVHCGFKSNQWLYRIDHFLRDNRHWIPNTCVEKGNSIQLLILFYVITIGGFLNQNDKVNWSTNEGHNLKIWSHLLKPHFCRKTKLKPKIKE